MLRKIIVNWKPAPTARVHLERLLLTRLLIVLRRYRDFMAIVNEGFPRVEESEYGETTGTPPADGLFLNKVDKDRYILFHEDEVC